MSGGRDDGVVRQATRRRAIAGTALVTLAAVAACSTTAYQAKFARPSEPHEIDADAPFLKCHTQDGHVYVLSRWQVDVAARKVTGHGVLYDAARTPSPAADHVVDIGDIALFETNRPETVTHDGYIVLAVITGASLIVTAACIANPKACFGSCPTFYATDGSHDALQAEGFSSSVARVFEATDVDAMWTARPASRAFDVRMTNEALETHVVDSVRVLAAPRPAGGRVLRAGDAYYPAMRLHAPSACTSPLGDCLDSVTAADTREYISPASSTDLADKEVIDLALPRGDGPVGIMIVARNSLLNTFVFYQGLAYMGAHAGDWFARLESGDHAEGFRAFGEQLGAIDVSVDTPRGWEHAGSFSEVGPIAHEVQLVVLPSDVAGPDAHVRLTLARGNWKIDQVALAELGAPVTPTALDPVSATRNGRLDVDALAKLVDPRAHLVTYPGDAYTLRFALPEGDSELFLESRGYYIEWMREAWLAEESPTEVMRILFDPEGALRRLAPKYKRIEGEMERVFWQSRFGARP